MGSIWDQTRRAILLSNWGGVTGLGGVPTERCFDATRDVVIPGVLQARILAKSGNELTKRVLVIADDSGASIELTIWGDNAEKFPDDSANAVIAFKGLRVTEWNQKSLGTSLSSTCARHAPATPTLWNSRGSPFPPQLRGRARARRDGAAAGVVRCWRQRGVAEPLGCRRDGRRGPRAHRTADLL